MLALLTRSVKGRRYGIDDNIREQAVSQRSRNADKECRCPHGESLPAKVNRTSPDAQ